MTCLPRFRCRRWAGLLIVGCLGAGQAAADPPGTTSAATPTVRVGVDWLVAGRVTDLAEGPVNPGNARLRLPRRTGHLEARGNLRVEFGSRLQVIVRPRVRGLVADTSTAPGAASPAVTREVDVEWTELYATWTAADWLAISYGLQNFQWGPAELLAPSNRIVHDTGVYRDPLHHVRGRHLLRVNLSAGRQWSLVTFAELADNGEPAFRAGEAFARRAVAKLEYTTADAASYVGGTFGVSEDAAPWFGLYGVLGLADGWSVYVDASHTRGSQAWYPVPPTQVGGVTLPTPDPPVAARAGAGPADPLSAAPRFARPFAHADSGRTLAVAGVRYTFVRGDDVRVEWLGHDAGWSLEDLRLAFAAARAASSPEAFTPYLAPGLDFLGRHLIYLSVRTPSLPPRERVEVQTRLLHSLTDSSRVLFVTGRWEAAAALIVFASAARTAGPPEGEFARFARGSVVAGLQWTW